MLRVWEDFEERKENSSGTLSSQTRYKKSKGKKPYERLIREIRGWKGSLVITEGKKIQGDKH